MSDIKLSDQLGAMAIIDELYQQQQVIFQHLDQASLRNKVAEKIKDYYQSKGLPVSDDVINEGVKLWFEKRLKFTVPNTSWWQNLLATCYVTRGVWYKVLAIVLACYVSYAMFFSYREHRELQSLQNNINMQNGLRQRTLNQLSVIKKRYDDLSKQPVQYAKQPVEQIKITISTLLGGNEITNVEVSNVIEKTIPIEQAQQKHQQLQQYNTNLQNQLIVILEYLVQLQTIIEQDNRLTKLIDDKSFQQASKSYPVVQQAVKIAIQALTKGDRADLTNIEALYSKALDANIQLQEVQTAIDQLEALKVPAKEMNIVLSLQESIKQQLVTLDFNNIKNYRQQLDYYIGLANTPLKLTIVDRVGYKSGIERTYDNSGGKAWYIIVEATTETNEIYPLQIVSNETGHTKLVKMFGIRVNKQEFDKVRQDKAADGHIDKPLVGNKPKGRLTFNYSRPIMDGTILDW